MGIPQQGTLGSSIPQQGTLGSSAVGFLQQGTLGSSAVGIPQQGTLGSSAVGIPQQGTLGSSAVGFPQQGTLGSSAVGIPQQGTLGSSAVGILQQGTLGSSAVGFPQQGTLGSSAVGIPQQGTLGSSAVGFPQQGTLGSSVVAGLSHTQVLQDPCEVCNDFQSVDEPALGKLARALASRSVFGPEILKQSTVAGDPKRGLKALDKTKLSELCTVIYQHPSFSNYSRIEFNALVKKSHPFRICVKNSGDNRLQAATDASFLPQMHVATDTSFHLPQMQNVC